MAVDTINDRVKVRSLLSDACSPGKENPLLIAGGVPSGFLGEIIYRDLLPLENVERQGQRSCGALKYLVNKKLRVWYVQITTNR